MIKMCMVIELHMYVELSTSTEVTLPSSCPIPPARIYAQLQRVHVEVYVAE